MQTKAYEKWLQSIKELGRKNKTPIFEVFELTPRCNLDCKMCYVHSQNTKEVLKRELTTEQWKKIMDEAYEAGMVFASLTGGECTLRKDFKELYLHLYNKGVHISVFTNGTRIDDDMLAFFLEHPPKMIQISLYGSSEEAYERVTGHRMFAPTIAAIKKVKAAGLDLQIAVTVSKYMKDDYLNIVRYCRENQLNMLRDHIDLFQNRDNPEKDDYFLTAEEIIELLKQRESMYTTLTPLCNLPEPGSCGAGEPDIGIHCFAGVCRAFISWDGTMYPCLNLLVNGQKVLETGFDKAWKELRATADSFVNAIECQDCAYVHRCFFCPVKRLQSIDSGHCNPDTCKLIKMKCEAGLFKSL